MGTASTFSLNASIYQHMNKLNLEEVRNDITRTLLGQILNGFSRVEHSITVEQEVLLQRVLSAFSKGGLVTGVYGLEGASLRLGFSLYLYNGDLGLKVFPLIGSNPIGVAIASCDTGGIVYINECFLFTAHRHSRKAGQ